MRLWVISEEVVNRFGNELGACGIELSVYQTDSSDEVADGFLLTKETDGKLLQERMQQLGTGPWLTLVYGSDVPYDWANTLHAQYEQTGEHEVIRMALFTHERALLGGEPNGRWMRFLCKQLARYSLVSMVCGMREVDEVLRQLPRYLAWKEQFYIKLGASCDEKGISLLQVSRALGMDKRIGQGWLYPSRQDSSFIVRWLEKECRLVLQKVNIQRIVLWGEDWLWEHMSSDWLAEKDVAVYTGEDKPIPNKWMMGWTLYDSWQDAVKDADLLVIGNAAGTTIAELPLPELVNAMRQSYVIDAAACFPVQEAQSYFQAYRAIGENTNVWE
ncbi:hypothetical protein [Brevibacillus porteri]|uniref:Uncharacterized protein n=1 Tax=Brevibacillus porteri TaxID=2126350 RepID=A0ABX5FGI3_9BACL|nr:hypothetical protein [Brevibacillus porteri]MED1801946.1 hypothetical protein [Brevibacillus porteri]MED2132507.1 hypothetical protein [Brevibacillus porteri]MED2745386.1 hypothetical protein [Brevibacillus porteri]MED2814337.1 hypothetical protein [Brevibacillus porteri]MED2892585.1 hypothetical protein [Brevibacillus porteri]